MYLGNNLKIFYIFFVVVPMQKNEQTGKRQKQQQINICMFEEHLTVGDFVSV